MSAMVPASLTVKQATPQSPPAMGRCRYGWDERHDHPRKWSGPSGRRCQRYRSGWQRVRQHFEWRKQSRDDGQRRNSVEVGDGSTVVLGNGQDTVTAGANTNIALGNGIDLVTTGSTRLPLATARGQVYSGGESTITVGNGNDTIYVGTADTIKV